MRRVAVLTTGLACLLILAACGRPGAPLAEPTVSAVSPARVTPETTDLTITGSNFFRYLDGEGARVEFCGVSAVAELVAPQLRTVTLAPAGRVSVETGSVLRAAVPSGIEAGTSALRVALPGGREVVLADAVTCAVDEEEPTPVPNRAPTARIALAAHEAVAGSRLLTYVSESTDPDGDELEYAWAAWSLPLSSEEAPTPQPIEGSVDGERFSVMRPEEDFHFLRLTVTDPHGLTDTVTFVTTLDPIGDVPFGGLPTLEQLDADEPPVADVVRTSWTHDPEADVTRFEVELVDAFTLPAPAPGLCSPPTPTSAGFAALAPQQAEALVELHGLFVFITGIDLDAPDAEVVPTMLMMYAIPNEAGKYVIVDMATELDCESGDGVTEVEPSVDGNVLRFAVPSAVVDVESFMFGMVGGAPEGELDMIPNMLALPILL